MSYIVKTGIRYYGPFVSVAEAVEWAKKEASEWPNMPVDFTIMQLEAP